MFAMIAASDAAVGTIGGVGGTGVIIYLVKNWKTLTDGGRFVRDAGHEVAERSKERADLRHQEIAAEARLKQDQLPAAKPSPAEEASWARIASMGEAAVARRAAAEANPAKPNPAKPWPTDGHSWVLKHDKDAAAREAAAEANPAP